MRQRLRWWFADWRQRRGWYRLEELQCGGHCGLCGSWVPNEVLPKAWAWTLCEKCERGD